MTTHPTGCDDLYTHFKHIFRFHKDFFPIKNLFFSQSRDEQKKQQLPRQLPATDLLVAIILKACLCKSYSWDINSATEITPVQNVLGN